MEPAATGGGASWEEAEGSGLSEGCWQAGATAGWWCCHLPAVRRPRAVLEGAEDTASPPGSWSRQTCP